MAFITVAGEELIAQKQGDTELLEITHFVLANIAGLGAEPVDRIESLPVAGDIVATLPTTRQGYVNENQIVLSLVMDSTIGDFSFNWVGLKSAEGTLVAVVYVPEQIKTATDGSIPGNNLTRNFLIAYSGIAATTAIDVPADTWQIDFTTRLLQIDQRERLSNFDIYGQAAFFTDGFLVSHVSGSNFSVNAGLGYVGGIRCLKETDTVISIGSLPKSLWIDASLQGDINGVSEVIKFTATSAALVDYTDANGFAHYVSKLADINAGSVVTDRRKVISGANDGVTNIWRDNSGLIIQRGTGGSVTGEADEVILPIPFKHSFSVVATESNAIGWDGGITVYGTDQTPGVLDRFLIYSARLVDGEPVYQGGLSYSWIAIGY